MELSVLQKPQRIVYVDDHGENVTALDHSLSEKYPQLEKILIRYSYLDQKFKNFELSK
jgi:creatinine amidohydrolase/Fe(II)-dependent formamide hydrolase-like protein